MFKGVTIEHTGLRRPPHYLCKWSTDLHNLHIDILVTVIVIYKPKIIKIYPLLLEISRFKVGSKSAPQQLVWNYRGPKLAAVILGPKSYLPFENQDHSMFRTWDIKTLSLTAVPEKVARGTKIEPLRRDISNYLHTKYHNNPSKGSWVILAETQTNRQTNRQGKNNTSRDHSRR